MDIKTVSNMKKELSLEERPLFVAAYKYTSSLHACHQPLMILISVWKETERRFPCFTGIFKILVFIRLFNVIDQYSVSENKWHNKYVDIEGHS